MSAPVFGLVCFSAMLFLFVQPLLGVAAALLGPALASTLLGLMRWKLASWRLESDSKTNFAIAALLLLAFEGALGVWVRPYSWTSVSILFMSLNLVSALVGLASSSADVLGAAVGFVEWLVFDVFL